MRRQAGYTVLEVMIASLILILLFAAVLAIYLTGLRATVKEDQDSQALVDGQKVVLLLSKALEQTSAQSITVADDHRAVSMLSAQGGTGPVALDEQGKVQWPSYQIFYHDQDQQRLYSRSVERLLSPQELAQTEPIEAYNPGGGSADLSHYLQQGRLLTEDVSDFQIQELDAPQGTYRFECSLGKQALNFQMMVTPSNP